jgi:hypothetical protein
VSCRVFRVRMRTFDPASGRKEAKRPGARSALVVAGACPPAMVLIWYVWAARASTTEITEQIFFVFERFHPVQIALETAGQQYLLYSHVMDEAIRRGIRLPLIEGKQYTEEAKDERIKDTLQPLQVQGRLCIHPYHIQFRDEYADFPRGATKDTLDAAAGCISLIPKPQPVLLGQDNRQAVLDYLARAHVGPRERAQYEMTLLSRGSVLD